METCPRCGSDEVVAAYMVFTPFGIQSFKHALEKVLLHIECMMCSWSAGKIPFHAVGLSENEISTAWVQGALEPKSDEVQRIINARERREIERKTAENERKLTRAVREVSP